MIIKTQVNFSKIVSYHIFLAFDCDDLLEDINHPLWVQDDCVSKVGLVLAKISKVDNPTQVMVEYKHSLEVLTNSKRGSHLFDLHYGTSIYTSK